MNEVPHASVTAGSDGSSPNRRPEDTRPGRHDEPEAELLVEDLLVEEVSIDGM